MTHQEEPEKSEESLSPLLTAIVIIGVAAAASIGAFYAYDNYIAEENNPYAVTFDVEYDFNPEGVVVVPQEFDKDCKYYANQSETRQEERKAFTIENRDDPVTLEGSTDGNFYQFCKDNGDTLIRSEVFTVYLQNQGEVHPREIEAWKDTNETIERLGNITITNPRRN